MNKNNLSNMLDSLEQTGIYVIRQDNHKVLYFNQYMKNMFPQFELGLSCNDMRKSECAHCPLLSIGEQNSVHLIHYNTPFGKSADIIANKLIWDGSIPAYSIFIIPHKMDYDDENGINRIEKMYAKSLVTVFNECIIANLTDDFYVNCQKDMMWTNIPERGQFGSENKHYAKQTVHPDDLNAFYECFSRESMLRHFKNGRSQITKRLRRIMSDGTYHMVEFTAARIEESGDKYWCVLVYRDINHEYLQEQHLNTEMIQLSTAAKTAFQMLISVNLTQNSYYMLEYNNFYTKSIPLDGVYDDLIKDASITIDPNYRGEFVKKFSRQSLLSAFTRGEKQVSMEIRQLGDDNIYHWNSTQVVMVENEYNNDILEISLTKNIDEERRIQEENLANERKAKELLEFALDKAESANNAKSDFMSKMSHDIRTPMNAIIGMTELAKIHFDDSEKLKDYLSKIEISSKYLLKLINEVLDVNKIESGKFVLEEIEFNLRNVIEDAVTIVQPKIQDKDQNFSLSITDNTNLNVVGDEQKLRQILINILENASKYTEPNGEISFNICRTDNDSSFGNYRFTIKDNGIGMKNEYIEHIFEPFSRADDSRVNKASGTGLGLTIVKNIIDMMGGKISVKSELGKGSCFTIDLYLPERESISQPESSKTEESVKDFSGKKILLVEDNEINQKIAKEILEYLGTDVETANNGREAVDILMNKPPRYYSIIFMDIRMPIMNGLEATKLIRSSGKEYADRIPIIAITADAFSEDVRKCRMAGMDSHLAKPISVEKLKKTLEQYIK